MEHASISSHEIVPEIDLKDIETPRTPDEVYGEIKRYFYKDRTSECLELV